MDNYRCRPCVKDYEGAALTNVRRCPQCGGPLLSLAQLVKHEQDTQKALDRLRKQSAASMAGCALLMVVMQAVFSFLLSTDLAVFNWLVFGVATASIVAAALWLFTAQKFWMLSGAILLQIAAAVFTLVAMGALSQIFMPRILRILIACLPMAGALLAWHQFRSYCQLFKLEQSKGRGSRVNLSK